MAGMINKSESKKTIKEAFIKGGRAKKTVRGEENIPHLFGGNSNEVGGLEFQKEATDEWQ